MAATLTEEIAAAAARLVVDEGMDYGAAKRRAARDLDAPRAELPTNEVVEDLVREHIALFHADTQPAELAALRAVALRWMERLAPFRPHLTGAAWRGTATKLNDVHIDLFCDDTKSAEIHLLDQRITYDVGTARGMRGDGEVDVLSITDRSPELGDVIGVHLRVLDHDDLRGALKPDAGGRTLRGDTAALRRLIEAEDTP